MRQFFTILTISITFWFMLALLAEQNPDFIKGQAHDFVMWFKCRLL